MVGVVKRLACLTAGDSATMMHDYGVTDEISCCDEGTSFFDQSIEVLWNFSNDHDIATSKD